MTDFQEIPSNTMPLSGVIDLDDRVGFDIINRTIVPNGVPDIIVQNDHQSRTIKYTIQRYFEKDDLSTKNITIHYVNPNKEADVFFVTEKTVEPNVIHFVWKISNKVTYIPGEIAYNIEFHDSLGYRWFTKPTILKVEQGLEKVSDGIPEPDEDWLTKWRAEAQAILNACTAAALRAEAAANEIHGALDAHLTNIASEGGAHGLRYFENNFAYYNGTAWQIIETCSGESGGGDGDGSGSGSIGSVIPGDMNMMNIVTAGTGKLKISFSDPKDSAWSGTKVVRKAGSYPKHINDGVLVLNSTVRDAYKYEPFVDSGLIDGTTYYYHFFPYSDADGVNLHGVNRITGTARAYRTMTAKIDLDNSNPATCISYFDDASGMVAGSEDWDKFFGHYPCLFKDGKVVDRLNRNNFSLLENGDHADIETGNAGDVMIAFPRRGVSISTVDNILTVKMTDDPDHSDFKYYAHTKGEENRDCFYLGAYLPTKKLGSVYSLSNNATCKIGLDRTNNTYYYFYNFKSDLMKKNPSTDVQNYTFFAFYQLIFTQCMYILKYKNLNSKAVLGDGYKNIDEATTGLYKTGASDLIGMDSKYVESSDTRYSPSVKLFGLEDFWSAKEGQAILGIWVNDNGLITTGTTNFTNHTEFTSTGIYTGSPYGFIRKVEGTSELGFLIKETGAIETTHFCGYGTRGGNNRILTIGGAYASLFSAHLSAYTNIDCIARMMYL